MVNVLFFHFDLIYCSNLKQSMKHNFYLSLLCFIDKILKSGGNEGGPRSNGSRKSTGGGRRQGGRWDTQGGREMREIGKNFFNNVQYFAMVKAHRGGNHYGRGREPRIHGTGSGKFNHALTPCPR